MNTIMLKAMNPSKYSKEELKKNHDEAVAAYVRAVAAVAAASAAAGAAGAAADSGAVDGDLYAGHWVDKYFKETGEKKQDYIDAINKDNK